MRRQESCHVHHTHRLQTAQHRSLLSGQARAREEKDLHGIGVLLFVRCAGSDQAYQDRGQRRHEGCERRYALLCCSASPPCPSSMMSKMQARSGEACQ